LNASNIASGTVPTARLASGTANSSTYLRGDSTWASVSGPESNNKQVFTSSGTFNVPAGVSRVKVTVIAAGGNAGNGSSGNGTDGGSGGAGGYIVDYVAVTPGGTATVTVGTNAGTRTSSFAGSTTITATGGNNGTNGSGSEGITGVSGASTIFGVTNYMSGASRTSVPINTAYETGSRIVLSGSYNFTIGGVYNHGLGAAGSRRYDAAFGYSSHQAQGYGAGGGGGTGAEQFQGGGTGTNGIVIVEW
jgi:hypothetical protein